MSSLPITTFYDQALEHAQFSSRRSPTRSNNNRPASRTIAENVHAQSPEVGLGLGPLEGGPGLALVPGAGDSAGVGAEFGSSTQSVIGRLYHFLVQGNNQNNDNNNNNDNNSNNNNNINNNYSGSDSKDRKSGIKDSSIDGKTGDNDSNNNNIIVCDSAATSPVTTSASSSSSPISVGVVNDTLIDVHPTVIPSNSISPCAHSSYISPWRVSSPSQDNDNEDNEEEDDEDNEDNEEEDDDNNEDNEEEEDSIENDSEDDDVHEVKDNNQGGGGGEFGEGTLDAIARLRRLLDSNNGHGQSITTTSSSSSSSLSSSYALYHGNNNNNGSINLGPSPVPSALRLLYTHNNPNP